MRIGKIILILGVFLLFNLPTLAISAEGGAASEPESAAPNESTTPTGNGRSSGSPAQRSSPCQQACYHQYKSGTDFCYSTSIASEDLNICIMGQREMFKICSKAC